MRSVPIIPSSRLRTIGKALEGNRQQLQATIVTLETAIAAVTAGTAKTALQAARDAACDPHDHVY